jgi:hypothetical protein
MISVQCGRADKTRMTRISRISGNRFPQKREKTRTSAKTNCPRPSTHVFTVCEGTATAQLRALGVWNSKSQKSGRIDPPMTPENAKEPEVRSQHFWLASFGMFGGSLSMMNGPRIPDRLSLMPSWQADYTLPGE